MTRKNINITLLITLVFTLLYMAFTPGNALAQSTATPAPPIQDYIEIETDEYMVIERTVTIGDLGLSIILLAILTTLFVYVAYKMVVDKLP